MFYFFITLYNFTILKLEENECGCTCYQQRNMRERWETIFSLGWCACVLFRAFWNVLGQYLLKFKIPIFIVPEILLLKIYPTEIKSLVHRLYIQMWWQRHCLKCKKVEHKNFISGLADKLKDINALKHYT